MSETINEVLKIIKPSLIGDYIHILSLFYNVSLWKEIYKRENKSSSLYSASEYNIIGHRMPKSTYLPLDIQIQAIYAIFNTGYNYHIYFRMLQKHK